MILTEDLFKDIAGSFPAGVAVLTTLDPNGDPCGLTTNAVCSVSATPPLLLACVAKTSRTLPALRSCTGLVINFLSAAGEEVSSLFASKSPDKFVGLSWRPAPHAGGAPILLDHIVAHAECSIASLTDAGDHEILLAGVLHGACYPGRPLMYFRRTYAAWPDCAVTP